MLEMTTIMNLMKKRLLIYIILATTAVACVYFYTKKPTADVAQKNKRGSFEQYYVPVTNYWSQTSNITTQELKNKKDMIIEKEEFGNLTNWFGEASQNTQGGDTKEIQKGLKEGEIAVVKWSSVTPNLKTLSVDGKYLWNKKDVSAYPLKAKIETNNSEIAVQKFSPEKLTKLTSTGDIIMGRTVAKKMVQYGYLSPWAKVADRIADADITFADLEAPFSDRAKPSYEGMSFIVPTAAFVGIEKAGIDIVALANNHSTNYGEAFSDTLALLAQKGVKYVGGGESLVEAEKAQIIEKNGQKWAFLNYNSIVGAINAAEDSAGVARFRIKPWSDADNEEDIQKIEKAISEAKKQSDVVVVEFHWGVEYTTKQIESQTNVAHRAIDAGADLVIGTHPHAVQGSEIYKGKYITYSLGNFIFDQEWSTGTKQGTVLESYFYGTRQVAANLVPIQIEDYHQPRFVTGTLAQSILDRIKSASVVGF